MPDAAPGTSGRRWLQDFCRLYGFTIMEKNGGGDCLFQAISDTAALHGFQYPINQLRNQAADEMQINPIEYEETFIPPTAEECIGLLQRPANNFPDFVQGTRTHEWGTEVTINSLFQGSSRINSSCHVATKGVLIRNASGEHDIYRSHT